MVEWEAEIRLGAVSSTLGEEDLEHVVRRFQSLELEAIELYCAGFHTVRWGEGDELLANKLVGNRAALDRFQDLIGRHGLRISAFSLHGEPLSPDTRKAEQYERQFRQVCALAETVGVDRLTLLAGLPEGAPGDRMPAWIVCPFPYENVASYEWQWEERVLPYWREKSRIADAHGLRLCFELHPGDVIYNPETLLRLRSELGPVAGCNLDPSHLFWQGIDPLEAVRALGEAIYHVHAKDCQVDAHNARVNGLLDPKPWTKAAERAWSFRIPGYGHGEPFWRDFFSTLRQVGYDDVISIECEGDMLVESFEGLAKAAKFLRPLIFDRPTDVPWWHSTHDPGSV